MSSPVAAACHFCGHSRSSLSSDTRVPLLCTSCRALFICAQCVQRAHKTSYEALLESGYVCKRCHGSCCCVREVCHETHQHCVAHWSRSQGTLLTVSASVTTPSAQRDPWTSTSPPKSLPQPQVQPSTLPTTSPPFLHTANASLRYDYWHMSGDEENFAEAQRHNRAVVTAALATPLLSVSYALQTSRFLAYNERVRRLCVSANAATLLPLGAHFAVEYLGPYRVQLAVRELACHGCGTLVRRGDHYFVHHERPEWRVRAFCVACVRYVTAFLSDVDSPPITPEAGDTAPLVREMGTLGVGLTLLAQTKR